VQVINGASFLNNAGVDPGELTPDKAVWDEASLFSLPPVE
jgi:hypothetical protein